MSRGNPRNFMDNHQDDSPRRGRGQRNRGMTDSLMATSLSRSLRSRKEHSYADDESVSSEEELQSPRKTRRRSERLSRDSTDHDERRGGRNQVHESRHIAHGRHHKVPRGEYDANGGNDEDGLNIPARRSSRFRSQRETFNVGQLGGGNDEEEDEEEDEENDEGDNIGDEDGDGDCDEEEGGVKKYILRNRSSTRRELLNIGEESTQNQSYAGEEEQSHLKNKQTGVGVKRSRSGQRRGTQSSRGDSFSYKQKRMYLGGRLPSPPKKDRSRLRDRSRTRDSLSKARRHYDSSSESSSSSSGFESRNCRRRRSHDHDPQKFSVSDEDENFRDHEQRRVARERESIMPMDLGGGGGGSHGMKDQASKRDLIKADVLPLQIDAGIGFASVGGLDSHLRALKEMVILPLLYPDVFQHFDTQPPRGVLFTGPPGCGKTLTARALANSLCASPTSSSAGPSAIPGGQQQPRKVSFFMRKGADCLSKWLGEGERQLRLLFDQARRYEPSIIFFDEIDGLAPVRSVKQDQIHASIVSTLLALMDGLDSRGQVVVIGATNRPDAIDPALRRPGRFDRELAFPLPAAPARRAILDIHTAKWNPQLGQDMKEWIINQSVGYCGADIKALCAEATIMSLRRAYPQVYSSSHRLALDPSSLRLTKGDFAASFSRIVPASRRASSSSSSGSGVGGVSGICSLLLQENVEETMKKVRQVFLPAADKGVGLVGSELTDNASSHGGPSSPMKRGGGGGEGAIMEIVVERGNKEEWLAALTDVSPADLQGEDCSGEESGDTENMPFSSSSSSFLWDPSYSTSTSRVMLTGEHGMCLPDIAAAALHHITSAAFPLVTLDLTSLFASDDNGGGYTPEQTLSGRLLKARQLAPSVVYFPDVLGWWRAATDAMKIILLHLMESSPVNVPILWLSTVISKESSETSGSSSHLSDPQLCFVLSWLGGAECQQGEKACSAGELRDVVAGRGSFDRVLLPCQVRVKLPSQARRESFFQPFFLALPTLPLTLLTARKKMFTAQNRRLEIAPTAAPASSSTSQQQQLPAPQNSISDKDRERDRHYFREQRLFFRAALGQLFKEKRFSSLSRPVDPEQVPDYYDVVLSPMDLETMRSKVDAHLYPTYDHFMYDIEQILYNAKLYNPTDGSSRGKSIVSAANQMVDAVESHAFHNVQIMKYNVFKKCEVAYYDRYFIPPPPPTTRNCEESSNEPVERRRSLRHSTTSQTEKPSPPIVKKKKKAKVIFDSRGDNAVSDINYLKQHRDQMPSENVEFYKHYLEMHQELVEELHLDQEEEGEGGGRKEVGLTGEKQEETEDTDSEGEVGGLKGDDQQGQGQEGVCSDLPSPAPPAVDLLACPLMAALEVAREEAKRQEQAGVFERLLERCVANSEGWSVAQLVALYSKFNRVSIQFQKYADWALLMRELDAIVLSMQTQTRPLD